MDSCWKDLPKHVFYSHVLPCLSIDMRIALKAQPKRLQISNEFISCLNIVLLMRAYFVTHQMCVGIVNTIIPIWQPNELKSPNTRPSVYFTMKCSYAAYENLRYGRDAIFFKIHKVNNGDHKRIASVSIPPITAAPRPHCCPPAPWD